MTQRNETEVFEGWVSEAPQMRDVVRRVRRVAASDAAVLVRGETGTGKELVARAVHALSARREAPFMAINCATLTPELLASELFGHVRGAFTGAVEDRLGMFALADGGTLFLDEVAELPLGLQARLLRVLQDQVFVPVGGTVPVHVDVRIVSATHEALRRQVELGRFREDLMYRIRVVPLFLPRLTERAGDVALLAEHFLAVLGRDGPRRFTGLHPAALTLMKAYDWPGNVRELRNVIEHALVMGDGPLVMPEDLTPELRGESPDRPSRPGSAEEQERRQILAALAASSGRRQQAADALGWSRSTLWRRMRELQIAS